MAKKMFYVELAYREPDAEPYIMQSNWFRTKREALGWAKRITYTDKDLCVYVMTAAFKSSDEYEILESELARP